MLAERIAAGPIPLEEAIQIARQIAEAVYVHDRGVIHRDLKPAHRESVPVPIPDFHPVPLPVGDPLAGHQDPKAWCWKSTALLSALTWSSGSRICHPKFRA